jgi:hypothetical protein
MAFTIVISLWYYKSVQERDLQSIIFLRFGYVCGEIVTTIDNGVHHHYKYVSPGATHGYFC